MGTSHEASDIPYIPIVVHAQLARSEMADDDLYGDLDTSADALKIKGVSALGVYVPVSHNDEGCQIARRCLFLREQQLQENTEKQLTSPA